MTAVTINPYSFNVVSFLPSGGGFGYGYGTGPGQIGISFSPVAGGTVLNLVPGVATTVAFASVAQNEGASDFYNALEGTGGAGTRRADGTVVDPLDYLRVPLSLSLTEGGDTRTAQFSASAGSGMDLYVGVSGGPESDGLVSDADVDYRLNLGSRTVTFASGDRLSIGLAPVELSANPQTATMQATFLLTSAVVDDYTDDATTAGTVAVGGGASGTIETSGDRDSFNVALTAGQTYSFVLRGQDSGGGTLGDPLLQLLDGSGAQVLVNDDTFALDSRITYTATSSGTFRLSAGGFSTSTGTYTLNVLPHAAATPGDDTLTDGPDSRHLDAGQGRDVLVVPGTGFRASSVLLGPNGDLLLAHAGQGDVLAGFEELRFIDGRLVLDPDDPAAQVIRLYQAALGRGPDQGGLNFWIGRLQSGASLSDLGAGFLGSAEFQVRFGNLDDAGYVSRLYQNVLNRAGDAGGTAYWISQLQGGASRQSVLAGFAESVENKTATRPVVSAGIWDRSEAAQQVARLYDAVLDRLPDAGGLAHWRAQVEDGTSNTLNVAEAFTASAEFTARYGALGNTAFVQTLYQNTLGRAGDAGGVAYWAGQLDSGALSRSAVVLGFSESPENIVRTAPLFAAENPASYGIALAG